MNRGKYGRTTLSVVLVAVMALVLQGCGGDDNNGMEQDLRDQVAMLEGQLSDAETAKAAADAARMTAEAAATDAMAAQTAAEAERDAANTAKGAAEQAQTTAEAAQMTAEEAQTAAETAQMTAETAQAAAVQAQAVAEAGRDAATGTLSAAEMARDAAKDAEAAAKVAQAQAEALQMTAEADSADAMTAQAAAETAQMAAEAAQAAAETAEAAAEAKAADYKMMADDAMAAQTAADAKAAEYKMMADDAETARMAAVEAQTAAEDKAAEYKMMADDAETARMAAVEAQKDAEDKAKMYKDQLAELEGEMDTDDMMDASAAAKALLAVLTNNSVANGNDSGLASAPLDDVVDGDGMVTEDNQALRNDVSNLMVGVSSDGMLMAEVEDDNNYSMSDMAPDMIEGWRGAMLTRDNADGTMDTVVVYTDIGNDGTALLLDRYTSTRPTATMPRSWVIDNDDTDETATGPVATNPDADISWVNVERPDSETAVGGTPGAPALTFKGSAHGIPGTFSCTDGFATCSAPVPYSDGKVPVITAAVSAGDVEGEAAGVWVFVPDAGVSLYTDDPTYLTFGWWLDKDAGGNPEDFRAFAMSSTQVGPMRTNGNTGGDLTGKGAYNGAAAGKYAMASSTADAYEGGHFTAKATLMVDFDAGDARDMVSLSGTIDDFMTGETARPDWMVKLMVGNAVSLVDSVDPSDGRAYSTEWSTGAAAKGTGSWMPTFYGGDGEDMNEGLPQAVTGTFNASIGTAAHLQGAFGANKME